MLKMTIQFEASQINNKISDSWSTPSSWRRLEILVEHTEWNVVDAEITSFRYWKDQVKFLLHFYFFFFSDNISRKKLRRNKFESSSKPMIILHLICELFSLRICLESKKQFLVENRSYSDDARPWRVCEKWIWKFTISPFYYNSLVKDFKNKISEKKNLRNFKRKFEFNFFWVAKKKNPNHF